MSCATAGFLSDAAGVVWNDVEVISVAFPGWSNVHLEGRQFNSILSSGEVDGSNSLYAWLEIEH